MINNVEIIQRKFECGKIVANYLIYEKKLPLLSVKNSRYYFIKDERLEDILDSSPWRIKLLISLT